MFSKFYIDFMYYLKSHMQIILTEELSGSSGLAVELLYTWKLS